MQAWREHEAELRAWLRRHLGNGADAEDLLQDLFVKALRQGDRFCSLEDVDLKSIEVGAYWTGARGTRAELVAGGKVVGMLWLP
jgi:hypothetical protein